MSYEILPARSGGRGTAASGGGGGAAPQALRVERFPSTIRFADGPPPHLRWGGWFA